MMGANAQASSLGCVVRVGNASDDLHAFAAAAQTWGAALPKRLAKLTGLKGDGDAKGRWLSALKDKRVKS